MPTPFAARRFVLALAMLPVVILAGCSGSGPATTTGASASLAAPTASAAIASEAASASAPADNGPLACDLVSTDMIKQALATTVAPGISQVSDLGGSTCEFKDAGLFIRVFPSRDASFIQSMKGSFKDAIDLPGVGDAAFYSQENATLFVLKGTTAVQVQAPNQNDQAKLVALAAAIVAKL